jgi:hypothetical protein
MYACACLGLAAAAWAVAPDGRLLMLQLTGALCVLAVGAWLLARPAWQGAWPWSDTLAPLAVSGALAAVAKVALPDVGRVAGTLLAGLAAFLVIATAGAASPTLRAMLGKTK